MKVAFCWLNGGLVLMIATRLLPTGLIQFHASVSKGLWYAAATPSRRTCCRRCGAHPQ
ncbi:hypothetical protein [Pseudomonas sp. PDM16]|uniref:hypothetical protein n=1 Tax=Pseudomonas sp. PDM16 TaxID=2769292 RepID=UPI001CE0571B|nr:hypothetical protein [Pseudomonas sp. PDM16]